MHLLLRAAKICMFLKLLAFYILQTFLLDIFMLWINLHVNKIMIAV